MSTLFDHIEPHCVHCYEHYNIHLDETLRHFFFICPKYRHIRATMLSRLYRLLNTPFYHINDEESVTFKLLFTGHIPGFGYIHNKVRSLSRQVIKITCWYVLKTRRCL